MKYLTVPQIQLRKQDTKEGVFTMSSIGMKRALQGALHEHGEYQQGRLHLDARDLPLADRKLLLSYLLDLSDYNRTVASPAYLEAVYKEHLSTIQSLLDDESTEVYHDCMNEMGMVKHTHSNNGETYWTKGN